MPFHVLLTNLINFYKFEIDFFKIFINKKNYVVFIIYIQITKKLIVKNQFQDHKYGGICKLIKKVHRKREY